MHPVAAIFCVCFDDLHYVLLAAYVSRKTALWNVVYKHYDNQRFSYVNERHFGFMLITYQSKAAPWSNAICVRCGYTRNA